MSIAFRRPTMLPVAIEELLESFSRRRTREEHLRRCRVRLDGASLSPSNQSELCIAPKKKKKSSFRSQLGSRF